MNVINTSTAEQRQRVLAAQCEGPRGTLDLRSLLNVMMPGARIIEPRNTGHCIETVRQRIAAISSKIIFTKFTKFTRVGSRGFTSHAMEADNRGSLSIVKRSALGVMFLQGTSSRQITGGLRMGAGCLPSSGVWGSRKAPAGLYAGESAPTRFRLSKKPCGNPGRGHAGPAGFLSNRKERANHG